MTHVGDTRERATQWIRWIARIWSAPIIVYALMMLIGYTWNWITIGEADPYAVEGYPFVEALPPILLFLSVVGLGIAWRWERLGGAIAIAFGLAVLPLLLIYRPLTRDFRRFVIPYLLVVAVVVPGVLLSLCGYRSRRMPISHRRR